MLSDPAGPGPGPTHPAALGKAVKMGGCRHAQREGPLLVADFAHAHAQLAERAFTCVLRDTKGTDRWVRPCDNIVGLQRVEDSSSTLAQFISTISS